MLRRRLDWIIPEVNANWGKIAPLRKRRYKIVVKMIKDMHDQIMQEHHGVMTMFYRIIFPPPKVADAVRKYDEFYKAYEKSKSLQTDPALEEIYKKYCSLPRGVFHENDQFDRNINRAKQVEINNFLLVRRSGDKANRLIQKELSKRK